MKIQKDCLRILIHIVISWSFLYERCHVKVLARHDETEKSAVLEDTKSESHSNKSSQIPLGHKHSIPLHSLLQIKLINNFKK